VALVAWPGLAAVLQPARANPSSARTKANKKQKQTMDKRKPKQAKNEHKQESKKTLGFAFPAHGRRRRMPQTKCFCTDRARTA